MDVLVSDTSVVIDLERAQLIERIFALPYRFVVPDALYEKELRGYGGEKLVALGLEVRSLNGEQVLEAQRLRAIERKISIHDSFALSLAKAEAAILLAGDAAMRRLAEAEGLRCHGVLRVFDQLEHRRVVPAVELHEGLTRLAAHPRCRLPPEEVKARIARFRGDEKAK